jgi:tetratricopeptide (TPR) repeat protein
VRSENLRPGVVGTDVLAAFYVYAEGREALARWDLGAAERGFRAALASDPEYAQASLWLAYAQMWGDEPATDWRANTTRALASPRKLGAPDLALARALWHLANGEFQQACAGYRAIVARDSTDFIAWFGLGECQRRDRIVVADPRSPSGWRFRSSYRAAAAAYRRALELVPSVHRAFAGIGTQRLMGLFFVETNEYRSGEAGATGAAAPTLRFAAFPSLDHDTLAFLPYPIAMVFAGRPEANPGSTSLAVERNRQVLREIIQRWIDAFPTSADALEALSLVLETSGELTLDGTPRGSALAAARRARALSDDAAQKSRLAFVEIRLLAKLEQFARARALADSILAAAPAAPDPTEAHRLAGLAALTGRVYRTAELLALSAPVDTPVTWDGEPLPDAPVPVKEAALGMLAYAALGGPVDSLRALKARVDRRAASWAGRTTRERLRLAVLHVPVSLAFPQLGLTDAHRAEAGGNYLLELQWAVTHGDTARVRSQLARLADLRSLQRPGDVSMDGTYHEAVLLLQMGDTAAATQLLDLSLQALATLGASLLDQVPQAAALVRAMALRADLAERAGDRTTAAHWARGVLDVWANADVPLGPTLASMRAITTRNH